MSCNTCSKCNTFSSVFHFNRIGTSVSRWCSDGGCTIPRPTCETREPAESSFMFLTQDQEFTLEPGQAFPFAGPALVYGNCFLCEDEVLAYQEESMEEQKRHCRKGCRGKCINPCNPCKCNKCPELALCCLPIVDETAEEKRLCMCGCCDTEPDRSECFHFEDGKIYVAPGIYFVDYTIQLPSGVDVHTEVHLEACGQIVPGSVRVIEHSATNGAETINARVLFDVCEPTSISLISSNMMSLAPSMCGEQLVTMTINGFC